MSNRLMPKRICFSFRHRQPFSTMSNRLMPKLKKETKLDELAFSTMSNRLMPKLPNLLESRRRPFSTMSNRLMPKPRKSIFGFLFTRLSSAVVDVLAFLKSKLFTLRFSLMYQNRRLLAAKNTPVFLNDCLKRLLS